MIRRLFVIAIELRPIKASPWRGKLATRLTDEVLKKREK